MYKGKSDRGCIQAPWWLVYFMVLFSLPLIADHLPSPIDGVYRGTIGRQQIVLEISQISRSEQATNYDDPEDFQTYPIKGSYFYVRHGVGIHLAGMPLKDGSLRLREYRKRGFQPYEFSAEWWIRFTSGKATGAFCHCNVTRPAKPSERLLRITLRRVSRHIPSPGDWENYKPQSGNAFYDLLLDFPLELGPEIKVNDEIAYRMRIDPRFKVSRPELTRFPDARVMSRINFDVQNQLTEARLEAARDISAGRIGGVEGGFYVESVEANFFPPDVLSILVQSSSYSGGAHPNPADYTLNYNLHTGRSFTLEHSFRTAAGQADQANVAALLAKLYWKHYVKPPRTAAAEDCDVILRRNLSGEGDYAEAFYPNIPLFISKKGLVMIPVFPFYADSGCAVPVTVPYNELHPFVRHSSPFYPVVKSAGGKRSITRGTNLTSNVDLFMKSWRLYNHGQ